MLGSIGSIDSSSTIFTFESIKLYDNLDITNLMELDVHIPNSETVDQTDEFYKTFLNYRARNSNFYCTFPHQNILLYMRRTSCFRAFSSIEFLVCLSSKRHHHLKMLYNHPLQYQFHNF